jgi:Rod binding domain-containing protein
MMQPDATHPSAPDLRPRFERPAPARDPLRAVAVEFEAMFLAEMLAHAGLGEAPEGFGGGAGEAAFGSFLVREQARLLAESGAVGLAGPIRAALARAAYGAATDAA